MSQAPAATPLSDADYHAKTKALLDGIESLIDRWLDEDRVDIDTHRTGGLLELTLPGGSKIVLNTQPPLQEIWMAARGGGFHFRYCEGRWLDTKTSADFLELLSQHTSAQAGVALEFSVS